MLVCDEHRFVFLRNPKTASRATTRALRSNFDVRRVGGYHNWRISKEFVGHLVFTTVRNPYERAVSGWQHWVNNGRSISFEKFLGTSTVKKPGMLWKLQSSILGQIDQKVHILRYESLEEDLNALPFVNERIVLPRVGVQNYGDWKSHYTPELEERVYKLLQKDFERFGYERWYFDKKQIGLL